METWQQVQLDKAHEIAQSTQASSSPHEQEADGNARCCSHPDDDEDQNERGVCISEQARSVEVRGWCAGVCACKIGRRIRNLAAAASDAVRPAMGTLAMACHLCAACHRMATLLLDGWTRTSATSCRPTPASIHCKWLLTIFALSSQTAHMPEVLTSRQKGCWNFCIETRGILSPAAGGQAAPKMP